MNTNGTCFILGYNYYVLLNRAGADHYGLRWNQNRGVDQCALGADVDDGGGVAGRVVQGQPVVANAVCDVRDSSSRFRQEHILSVVGDRGEQTTLGVDSDTQVDLFVVDNLLGLLVLGSVDARVADQSLNGCLRKEW